MSTVSKMAWVGLVGGAFLLAAQWACVAGTENAPFAAAIPSASDANANPYAVIIERNAFHLNPPPPPPEANKAPPPHLSEIKLSGFVHTGNQWKVLLAVSTENPDPRASGLTSYLALSEGDKRTVGLDTKQVVVELVKIYADEEKADIINSGTPVTLSMKDDGFESPTPPPDPSRPRTVTPAIRSGSPTPLLRKPPVSVGGAGAAPVAGENSGGGSAGLAAPASVGTAPSTNAEAAGTHAIIVGRARGTPP